MTRLSIVVPCFNEESVLSECYRRLKNIEGFLSDCQVEIIFIDDGSRDSTLTQLRELAQLDSNIRVIAFARNFGHQIAVTAGIDAANGDAIVIIDADLQDPPELIPQMVNKWREGFDVVYGTRVERMGESWLKLKSAKIFYRLLNRLSDTSIPLDTGDFRLISRSVARALKSMPERDRFLRGMISWIGFKQISLPYKRHARFAGDTKYPFKRMLSFAVDSILSFSSAPLKISIALGFFSAALALAGIIYAVSLRLLTNLWVEGWTALMIAILFLGGIQLISVGILGAYIGRIYSEIKGRPLYIVQERIGFESHTPE